MENKRAVPQNEFKLILLHKKGLMENSIRPQKLIDFLCYRNIVIKINILNEVQQLDALFHRTLKCLTATN